jgi:WD40 repeat protein
MKNETANTTVAVRKLAELDKGYGNRVAFDPDGQRWATATTRDFHLWRDQELEDTITAEGTIHGLAFRTDGHALALCPLRYDLDRHAFAAVAPITGQLVAGLDDPPPPDQLNITACAEAEDGTTLVVAARHAPSRKHNALDTYRGPLERVLLLHGEERAFKAALYEGDEEIRALAVGSKHVVGGGRTMRVWNRATGQQVAKLVHHPFMVRMIAFSPDERALYAVGADGLATVWRTADWTLHHAWQAHEGDVPALALHPRQPLLATGGNDGTLRLWSMHTPGQLLHEQTLAGPVEGLAFDAAHDRLAAAVRALPARIVLFELDRDGAP